MLKDYPIKQALTTPGPFDHTLCDMLGQAWRNVGTRFVGLESALINLIGRLLQSKLLTKQLLEQNANCCNIKTPLYYKGHAIQAYSST